MKPFKKILVPVDFSVDSDAAVLAAVDLARRTDGAITLAHVFQPVSFPLPDGYMLFTPTQMSEMITLCGQRLAHIKTEALASGAPRVNTEQLLGIAATEIVAYATKHDCDLVVMGTRGRTGIAHALMGSVSERVVRSAPCPVLTVRSSTH